MYYGIVKTVNLTSLVSEKNGLLVTKSDAKCTFLLLQKTTRFFTDLHALGESYAVQLNFRTKSLDEKWSFSRCQSSLPSSLV